MLTRLLEEHKDSLPFEAAAFLDLWPPARLRPALRRLGRTIQERCRFGRPLLNALTAIETLARPENRHLLEEAQAKLPSGYEVISMALVNYGVLTRTVP